VRITTDTNVLVRACVRDDPEQARSAADILGKASLVAVPTIALCEFAWVLDRAYKFATADIANAIRLLVHSKNVVCDMPTVEAGLSVLEQGGDFADGAIAFSGLELGGIEFVSFDSKAVKKLKAQRKKARLL
jgi:predicted nucleic-acid-binding protein